MLLNVDIRRWVKCGTIEMDMVTNDAQQCSSELNWH